MRAGRTFGPVLICTSNYNKSLPEGVDRRVKEIHISSSFPISDANESSFASILGKCSTAVFREVSFRLIDLVGHGISIYRLNENDPLYFLRSVLKELYAECGMELPEFFPEKTENRRDKRGRSLWRNFYAANPGCFYRDPSDDGLLVAYVGNERNDKLELSNLLNSSYKIVSGSSYDYIRIQRIPEFFAWMGIPLPSEFKRKVSFFHNVRQSLGRLFA